tara:strand:+ start:9480 stop:10727 length:1248 start_codon:yes stop_codon:yes gene_type:complete
VSSPDSKAITKELASAAEALHASPRDLGAWWRIADALAELGDTKAAGECLADLGRAASDLGAVALAVSCVLALRKSGDDRRGSALLDRIAKTHCRDSKRVEHAQGRVPPAPPAPAGPAADVDADAKKSAKAAVNAAVKDARARAPKTLPPTPLIRFLSAEDFQTLVDVMTSERFSRGQVIVDFGDTADALYWIARGGVEVSRGEKLLGELRSDAFFGEIALIGATTRTARVACLEETDVLVIPAVAALELVGKAPSLAKVLASHARSRLLSNVMRTSELFRRLSRDERRSLLPHFETTIAEEGDFVLKAGEDNQSFFVLASGSCSVMSGDTSISELGVGHGFGEMSMLGRKPATFDVVATSSALLLSVSRDKFNTIAADHPELLAEVYKLLVDRERENEGVAVDATIVDADDLII